MVEGAKVSPTVQAIYKSTLERKDRIENIALSAKEILFLSNTLKVLVSYHGQLLDRISATITHSNHSIISANNDLGDASTLPKLPNTVFANFSHDEITNFFQFDDVEKNLKNLSKQLLSYARQSDIIARIPDKLLSEFVNNTKEILKVENGHINKRHLDRMRENLSYLSFDSFSKLLKERQALYQFRDCQKNDYKEIIDGLFSWFSTIVTFLFHPLRYWRPKGIALLKARNELKNYFYKVLEHNENLIALALKKNIDNFIRHWFVCMSDEDFNNLSSYEKGSIERFLSDQRVIIALKESPHIPKEIKPLLDKAPMEAFAMVVATNHSYYEQQKSIKSLSNIMPKPKQVNNADNANRLDYESTEDLAYLRQLIKAFYQKEAAYSIYGRKKSLLDGVIINANPRRFYIKSKRLNKLYEYGYLIEANSRKILEILKSKEFELSQQQSLSLITIKTQLNELYQKALKQMNNSNNMPMSLSQIEKVIHRISQVLEGENLQPKLSSNEEDILDPKLSANY